MNEEAGLHQTPNLLAPSFGGMSASRTVRIKCVLFIGPSVYGILLQQPKWTKTTTY